MWIYHTALLKLEGYEGLEMKLSYQLYTTALLGGGGWQHFLLGWNEVHKHRGSMDVQLEDDAIIVYSQQLMQAWKKIVIIMSGGNKLG